MRDPNDVAYFDEEKGCTYNLACPLCKKPIWARSGVHTVYIGKKYTHNRPPYKVVSVVTEFGCVCEECFNLLEEGSGRHQGTI
jgi:hypothetical protein